MNHKVRKKVTSFIVLQILLGISIQPQIEAATYYVTPTGHDSNLGTKAKPLATLEAARNAIRKSGVAGKERCVVWLADGTYQGGKSFSLSSEDSGSKKFPVIYSAMNKGKAKITGSRSVASKEFKKVTSADVLARMQPAVQNKILKLDLKKMNLQHKGIFPDLFNDNGGILELFINHRRAPISRYPNDFGDMTMKKVLLHGGGQETKGNWNDFYSAETSAEVKEAMQKGGKRPGIFEYSEKHKAAHERWAKVVDRGVWVKGYWRVAWENQAVRVASIDTKKSVVMLSKPIPNGIGSKYHRPGGSGAEIYWVINLLEEVDQPGEWALDFKDQAIYIYRTKDFNKADIQISDDKAPVISLADTSYVTLQGFTVEGSLSDGIHISGGTENSVLGCTIRNVAKYGVKVENGFKHVVRSCDLHSLGAGGVWLSGGDSKASPRIPAGHRVVNNDIHHFGEIERVYAPGVNVGFRGGGGGSAKVEAVGMTVSRNAIHDCPHAGVLFNSFDNVYELNEVFRYAQVSNDMGAFYSYSKEGGIGNTVFRYNLMRDSLEGDGLYFDNLANKPTIIGNIAYGLGSQGDRKAKRGTAFLIKNFGESSIEMRGNITMNCKEGFYARWDAKKSNIKDNLSISCVKPGNKVPGVTIYNADPGIFKDVKKRDFTMLMKKVLAKDVPGLKKIPFEKIGLYKDAYRKTIPDYRSKEEKNQSSGRAVGYGIKDRE